MTDNEIKKALECCFKGGRCISDCLYDNGDVSCIECTSLLEKDALDLINRQQAEIERLQHEILSCNTKIQVLQEVKEQLEKDVFNAQMNCDSIAYEYELLKQEKTVVQSEAIKEFAERLNGILKKKRKNEQSLFAKTRYGECILAVDNLVKEMTEGCDSVMTNAKRKGGAE